MAGTTLGTAYVQVVPLAQGIKGSLTEAMGGEASSAGIASGKGFAAGLKGMLLKAGIGAAVVGTFKAAIGEGAKLQQSYLGGLDTLYGDAADTMREYARQASAAGISMNDYSEQAVSFGAALKQSFGGDTKKAAESANTALLDMADNAAKMGTPLEQIQTAYQGFAKGNYTMLDNLKLGYGGTKEEMQRLLADAQKISGVEYDMSNLGDVYEAIHVIQGDLGLTGVAAEEASQTFSGSFGAMKAAAANFMGSLALGENVVPALQTLLSSVGTFLTGNLLPMVGTIVRSLPPVIVSLVRENLPVLLENIVSVVTQLATSLKARAEGITAERVKEWALTTGAKLVTSAFELIKKFATGLLTQLPTIVSSIGKIGLAIVQGLGQAIWPKITAAAQGIKEKFMAPIETLKQKVSNIVEKIKGFFKFNISLPHIKLPHFAIKPAGWKIGDLLKGSIPSLGISWYAKGGIADGATLIGAGEKGAEAILPLKPFWDKMDKLIEGTNGSVTINVYAPPGMSVTELANAVEQRLVKQTQQRRNAWGTI